MYQLTEAQASSLIPSYWRVLASSTADILFLGKVNIRGMIRHWRYEASSLASQMKEVDANLTFLKGKNDALLKQEAARFENPTFPNVGLGTGNWSGDPEPLDSASVSRQRGTTTLNVCGWCKHAGGGTCRYSYYITTRCSIRTNAGLHEDERKFNTPCFLPAATDSELDELRTGLATQLQTLKAAKADVDDKIVVLLECEKHAEKKPAFPGHRPHDWFNEDDPVVCFVGSWKECIITNEFATAKVILGYRHHDGCVSVCFDSKVHNGKNLDGHGGGYGMSRPEVMHVWEYEYMLKHPDFCNVWLKLGTSDHLEGFIPDSVLGAFARVAVAQSKQSKS